MRPHTGSGRARSTGRRAALPAWADTASQDR